MTVLLLPLGLLIVVLILGVAKARHAFDMLRWASDTPDRVMRRLLAVSIVPGVLAPVVMIARGVDPSVSFVVGLLAFIATLVASAGALGVEGALIEPGSEADVRALSGRAAKSTPAGRAIAIAIGLGLAAAAGALGSWSGAL